MSIIESVILIVLVIYFVATSMKIFKLNSEAYEIQKQAFEHEKEIEEIEQKLKSMHVVTERKDCKYIKERMKNMYESPIQSIPAKICTDLDTKILKTINFEYGVKIDKQELIRALEYDRNQYEKGYSDRDSEIVRCKDCLFCRVDSFKNGNSTLYCYLHSRTWDTYEVDDDDYCSRAERKDEKK